MADANLLTQVFSSNGFSLIEMTNTLVLMPHVGTLVTSNLNWTVVKSRTKNLAVDTKQHYVYLLGTVARGAPLPQFEPSDRGIYEVLIPRVGERGEVTLDELLDLRKFGSNDMEDYTELRDERMSLTKARLVNTDNFSKAQALKGLVVDAKSGRILSDLKEIRGVTQPTYSWDLTTCDPNELLAEMKRQTEQSMGDMILPMRGYKLLCGREFYLAMRKNPNIKQAWLDYQSIKAGVKKLGMTDRDVPGGFELADDVKIVDMGRDRYNVYDGVPIPSNPRGTKLGTQCVIPDWSAVLVPDADGFYISGYGPSEKLPFVGNVLPYYVIPKIKDDLSGVEWTVDSYSVNFVQRPELLSWVNATQGYLPDGVTPVPLQP